MRVTQVYFQKDQVPQIWVRRMQRVQIATKGNMRTDSMDMQMKLMVEQMRLRRWLVEGMQRKENQTGIRPLRRHLKKIEGVMYQNAQLTLMVCLFQMFLRVLQIWFQGEVSPTFTTRIRYRSLDPITAIIHGPRKYHFDILSPVVTPRTEKKQNVRYTLTAAPAKQISLSIVTEGKQLQSVRVKLRTGQSSCLQTLELPHSSSPFIPSFGLKKFSFVNSCFFLITSFVFFTFFLNDFCSIYW